MTQNEHDLNTTNIPLDIKRLQERRRTIVASRRHVPSRLPGDIVPWVLEFHIVGASETVRAPASESFFFGRTDVKRNIHPDVDLTPYGGKEEGVSREHARILCRDNRILVQDLGSANGTFINGVPVEKDQPLRLRDGDELLLGFLRLEVKFVIKPTMNDETIIGYEDAMPIPRIGNGEHLLILDDNEDTCKVLHFLCSRAGFRVTTVNSITEAVAQLESESYQGLILELMLPNGNGLDVLRYVRQKIQSQMPIIAMSGKSGFIVNKARAQGANIFIAKPMSLEELVQHLPAFVQDKSEESSNKT